MADASWADMVQTVTTLVAVVIAGFWAWRRFQFPHFKGAVGPTPARLLGFAGDCGATSPDLSMRP